MAPWNREVGPIGKAQKEGDVIKKKVDQLIKESTKVINNKKAADRDAKLEQMYTSCIETKTAVQTHYESTEKLTENDEPVKLKDYDKRKTTELNRMTNLKTQLMETMDKLLPGTTEADFLKLKKSQLEGDQAKEDDDDDEEEDEEEYKTDDDDDDDKQENGKTKTVSNNEKRVIKGNDEEEEDSDEDDEDDDEDNDVEEQVNVKENKQRVEQKTQGNDADEDEDDDKEEEEEEDDDEDEDEDEDSEDGKPKKDHPGERKKTTKDTELMQASQRFIAIQEFDGEQEGDLSFEKGDVLTVIDTREDGWWTAVNGKGQKGLVPSTFLKVHNQYERVQKDDSDGDDEDQDKSGDNSPRKSGKALWGGIKKAVQETTVSDVLHAMGAVPSGFRPSTLCQKFNEGKEYRMANYLVPKLSESNLAFKDLKYDPVTNRISQRSARIERLITLVSCPQIPPPGAGIEVLDRHVRICLFDGKHILSNIHSVQVASVDKSARTWTFTTRVHDLMDPHMHGEVFVRSNNTKTNIGVLFELCITYKRISTEEQGEFSCGWVHLPLLESELVVGSKSLDLYVHGGTCYETGVEVDPNISRRTSSNALVSLLSGNRQPRLVLKIQQPRQIHKELMGTLPDTLVGNTCLLRIYSLYRQCLVDVLLRDRLNPTSTELIHDPLLTEFPMAADVPDLMELLIHEWIRNLREVKKDVKLLEPTPLKDEEFMKKMFRRVFMETVFPVSHLANLPAYRLGEIQAAQQVRRENVRKFAEVKKQGNSPLAALLSADLKYQPFLMEEVTFDVLGPFCVETHG